MLWPSADHFNQGPPGGRLREETMHNKAMIEFGEILRGTLIERDHPDYEERVSSTTE
jgi:hypothetical protein